MSQTQKIVGFEFNLYFEDGVGDHWTQLQGSGGLLGDGCLHISENSIGPTCLSLLREAQSELRREKTVRIRRSIADHVDEIIHVMPDAVIDCRPIYA